MDPCLKALRKNKVYVRRVIARDGPQETLGEPIEMLAFVEMREREQQSTGGTELVTETLIVTEEEITLDDRIWVGHPAATSPPDTSTGGSKPRVAFPRMDPIKPFEVSHYETIV